MSFPSESDLSGTIARLFVYPVKSCAGIEVQQALLSDAYLQARWAGIDLNSGFEQAPGLKDTAALSDFIYSFKQNKYNF